MSQPRPTAVELLDAVASFLDEEVVAALDGSVRFQTRVAVGALRIVMRELEPAAIAAAEVERVRLCELLGADGADGVVDMERELARRIRAGEVADDDPALMAFVERSVTDALAVSNPKYAAS